MVTSENKNSSPKVRAMFFLDLRSARVKVENVCGREKSQMLIKKSVLKLVGNNLYNPKVSATPLQGRRKFTKLHHPDESQGMETEVLAVDYRKGSCT